MKQEEIERALEVCYDAILAPEIWPDAMHRLAKSVGAAGCRFRVRTGERAVLQLPASPALGAFLAEFARDGWWRNDPRAAPGYALVASGARVVIDHDIASDEERRKLPFYADFSHRHDLPWWCAVPLTTGDDVWVLSLFRNGRQGPFNRREAQRLPSLAPHGARMIRSRSNSSSGMRPGSWTCSTAWPVPRFSSTGAAWCCA